MPAPPPLSEPSDKGRARARHWNARAGSGRVELCAVEVMAKIMAMRARLSCDQKAALCCNSVLTDETGVSAASTVCD